MARANSKGSSSRPPVLTNDSRTDWALWQLSFLLTEIAQQASRNNNEAEEKLADKSGRHPAALPNILEVKSGPSLPRTG
jgi:hypothetical protein